MREVAHARKQNPLSDLSKILHGGRHPRVIICANFSEDRLRGLGVSRGYNLSFAIDFDCRPYNILALPRDLAQLNVEHQSTIKNQILIVPPVNINKEQVAPR